MTDAGGSSIGWLIQTAPGLAPVVKREMIFTGAADRKQELFIKRHRNHDLAFTNRVKDPEKLKRLRIAEMVLRSPIFGRFKISKRQLATLAEEMKALGPRRLVVSAAGRHFQRHDLARWLMKEMHERGYDFLSHEVEDEDDDVIPVAEHSEPAARLNRESDEVWMFCIDEAYYFGIPIAKAREAEGRANRVAERRGSLPPTIAAAVAFAAQAKNDDVILDPTCGSGTLLAEVHAYAPQARLIGVDVDAEAVKIAKQNLAGLKNAEVIRCDSRTLAPIEAGQLSLALANLPFGEQFGSREKNPELYSGILRELIRLKRDDGWRAIVLTSDASSLDQALRNVGEGLSMETMFKVKIRGEAAAAYRIQIK